MTELQQRVIDVLRDEGELQAPEIAKRVGVKPRSVRSVLLALNGKGRVKRNLNGPPTLWRIP